nr:EOG090X017N [Macrothrix elegans]
MIGIEEAHHGPSSSSATISTKSERQKLSRLGSSSHATPELKGGTGHVVSSFPVMQSHVVVSSRVDIRIGGSSKAANPANKAIPNQVEVKTEMRLSPEMERFAAAGESKRKAAANMPPGQSLVSKTVGTRIHNGMTTVHETSVIATTIDGQYAHFVQSSSTIFREDLNTASVVPATRLGTVEVVTDPLSVNTNSLPTKDESGAATSSGRKSSSGGKSKETASNKEQPSTSTEDKSHLASLPSLESLFGSVSTGSEQQQQQTQAKSTTQSLKTTSLSNTTPVSNEEEEGDAMEDEEAAEAILKPVSGRERGQHKFAKIETTTTSKPKVVKEELEEYDTEEEEDAEEDKVTIKPSPITKQPTVVTTSSSLSSNLERRAGLASSSKVRDSSTARPLRTEEQRWRYNPTPKPKVPIQRNGGSGGRFRVTTPNTPPKEIDDDANSGASYNEPESDLPDPTEVITLRVHTVTPEGYSNLYYEVATIKSPYIMRLGAVRNTRYVTLTRSFTRLITPTPPPAPITATADPYGSPEQEGEVLLDGTQSLPDPENILATTTPYESILKDSSDVATLPAIIIAATENDEALKLKTVTETFSTTELTMKTSILPYLKAGVTSHMTLTQSYYITRVVVAVKTVPPPDLYQFIPSKRLTDISTNLQEAGSEHNERLLPGELEFSENEEYDEDDERHQNEKRVPVPPDFLNPNADLPTIGQDFDPSSVDRPAHSIELEPSLVDTTSDKKHIGGTTPLPNGAPFQLGASAGYPQQQQQQLPGQQDSQVLTPEQLQQLALFRFMNPYAAAAAGLPFGYPGIGGFGGQGQVITTSKPVTKTVDVVRTETLPIWDGARTIYSTLTRVKGSTVVTETEYGTTTLPPTPINPLFPAIQPQYTVVSTPLVTEITTTSTELRIYRIIFRAQTTYTTVTSTSVFPTIVTTYVTSTVPIQPTAFPQALFPGSFGFPNFG